MSMGMDERRQGEEVKGARAGAAMASGALRAAWGSPDASGPAALGGRVLWPWGP